MSFNCKMGNADIPDIDVTLRAIDNATGLASLCRAVIAFDAAAAAHGLDEDYIDGVLYNRVAKLCDGWEEPDRNAPGRENEFARRRGRSLVYEEDGGWKVLKIPESQANRSKKSAK